MMDGMFTSSAFETVQKSPGHLIISAPGASISIFSLLFFVLVFPLCFGLAARSAKRSNQVLKLKYPEQTIPDIAPKIRLFYFIGAAITFGGPILFYCFGYTSGSFDFDRPNNRAAMTAKMTVFLPTQTQTIKLDAVQGAVLDYKPNSRRIRLNVSHGQDLAYPVWSDRPGQQEAVDVINSFLHGSDKN